MLKAQFAELYGIIADGESKVDAIIAEETRKRNDNTTERLLSYIKSKIGGMALEADVVDYVDLKKAYYNKTAKEAETLDDIDDQLAQFESNFAAFLRAEKKINKFAQELGAIFNKGRYLYGLNKYGDNNDSVAAQAEEEAERIRAIPAEEKKPVVAPVKIITEDDEDETILISTEFPVVDKKKSKGSDELLIFFTVPKEAKKQFAELLKLLKDAGIKSKKL